MKNSSGIWIDSKKAIIVHLKEDDVIVHVIHSGLETRVRIPGEVKWFARFGNQYFDFEKRKENRYAQKVKTYLNNVITHITDAKELVILGPASMKIELEKAIRKKTTSPIIREIKTAESMTENQIVAWVKDYFAIN